MFAQFEPSSRHFPRFPRCLLHRAGAVVLSGVFCLTIALGNRPSRAEAAPPSTVSKAQKMHDELLNPTFVDFGGVSFDDVAKYYSELHGINIQLDTKELESLGLTGATITLGAKGMSLRSGLRFVLRSHGLSYVNQDDMLLITSRAVAERTQLTRFYNVTDLLEGSTDESLRKLISSELEVPDEMQPTDPKAAATGLPALASFHKKILVVRASTRQHERVQDLLDGLRKALATAP